jgi:hypothetical protein
MKKILVVIVVLAYAGFFSSTANFAIRDGKFDYKVIISSVFLLTVNCLCARHLYKKAEKNKAEWALFGLIGNLTALLCFWDLRRRHRA